MTVFNPDPNAPTPRQVKLLALAAVFQSAGLAYAFATQGSAALHGHQAAFDALLKMALSEETDILTRLGGVDNLSYGLKSLEGSLNAPFPRGTGTRTKRFTEPMRYAFALLQIERKIYSRVNLVAHIEHQQKILTQRIVFFDQRYRHPSILAGMAATYLATAGTLRTRLSIKGQQTLLTDPSNVDCIRACLFAGIQAAHLWRGLGGRRLQLIFGRRAMQDDLRALALNRYRTKKT
jgi:high frequency lysogenization protein